MTEIHQIIIDKLKKYPRNVQALGKSALELSESMPPTSVAEQLKGVVRQIIQEKEATR